MTIVRYLTDHVASNALSLSVLHRIASTDNVAALVIPLLLKSPWKRSYTGSGGGIQKWKGGEWRLIPQAELHALDMIDVQAFKRRNRWEKFLVSIDCQGSLDCSTCRGRPAGHLRRPLRLDKKRCSLIL
ncbi:hypothetical protein Ndes2437B_g01320 [Nannochloris sp. 'desiccata']